MTARLISIAAAVGFCATRAYAELPPCNGLGMTTPAATNLHIASEYPILSMVLHEEGTTILAFVIGTDGRISTPAVAQSSGSLRLDDASKEAARGWLYSPALIGGLPTACVQHAQVKWRIPEAVESPKKAQ